MADTTYKYGPNRIVYQAGSFATGLTVTARMWDPSLIEFADSPFTLTELGHGLYHFLVELKQLEPHHGVFFEGGTAKVYQTFRVVTKFS